jgi:hypothetical protein
MLGVAPVACRLQPEDGLGRLSGVSGAPYTNPRGRRWRLVLDLIASIAKSRRVDSRAGARVREEEGGSC